MSTSLIKEVNAGVISLAACDVTQLEKSSKELLSTIINTLEKIYEDNNFLMKLEDVTDLTNRFTSNFKVAEELMDCTKSILMYLNKSIDLIYIPTTPIQVAHILHATFDHCKNGQKFYSNHCTAVVEIVELFKKTQETHNKFLLFLDLQLRLNTLNEIEVGSYKNILEYLLQIGKTLSGINMKSMTDNWKCFLALMQKFHVKNVTSYYFSIALNELNENINNNLKLISENELKKLTENINLCKVTSFLLKVALKLIETDLELSKSYEAVFKFWAMIFSWQNGFFSSDGTPEEITDIIRDFNTLPLESFLNLLKRDPIFITYFINCEESASYGAFFAAVIILKELPKLKTVLKLFTVDSFLRKIFTFSKNFYKEFFIDYNSTFYEDLIVAIAVATLLFPDRYFEVETLFLEHILDNNIWTFLIALDSWCLILSHCSDKTRYLTFLSLINKIEALKLGIFMDSSILRLKILMQRIFEMFSDNTKNEEMLKYSSCKKLAIWKILSLKAITCGYRYYVEFLLSNICEKVKVIQEENCHYSLKELLHLIDVLDIISYTNFYRLQIKTSYLIPLLKKLWSFDAQNICPSNNMFNHFISSLIKITVSVTANLDGEAFLLILTQLKSFQSEITFKLYICEFLCCIAKKQINLQDLIVLMHTLFEVVLMDKNAIVVEIALQSFFEVFKENNYEIFSKEFLNGTSSEVKKHISNYTKKTANKNEYESSYFTTLQSFSYQHQCLEWNYEPAQKKIKFNVDLDYSILRIKEEVDKLVIDLSNNCINENQKTIVKYVIKKLEKIVLNVKNF